MFGVIAGALVAGSGVRAQTPPTPPPTPPISDGPSVIILATDPTALGGTSSGAFTVILNATNSTDLPVTVAISGSASNTFDYIMLTNGVALPTNLVNGSAQTTNVIVIPAGYLAVDILVQPLPDKINSGNKTVTLTVATNANYAVLPASGRGTVTIIDDIYNIPPPGIEIIVPTNGSVFWYATNIVLTADAGDPSASISSVSFYANDTFLGKGTNSASPFSMVWTNARPGRYTLFARAVDSVGQSTLSAPVQITVTNVVPVVELTSPTDGSNFPAGQDITLQAQATDAANAVTNITFYVNGRAVNSVAIPLTATSPYSASYTWNDVHAGFYVLQVSATDTLRNKVYSPRVTINVTHP